MGIDFKVIVLITLCVAAQTAQCVTLLNATADPQTFTSPNYPDNYPRNVDELWQLTTLTLDSSLGSWVLNLEITDFQLEAHSSCAYDFLEIYDGDSTESPSLSKLCGPQPLLVFSSTGDNLYFLLRSDYSVTDRGFTITYWATYTAFAIVTQPPPVVSEQRNNSYKIIGGVVGGVAGLTLLGFIIYCCVCRRRYKEKERTRKILRKVYRRDSKGKLHRTFKTIHKYPYKPISYDEKQTKRVSVISDPGPESARSIKPARVSPDPGYMYWGRQAPSPFRYIEPTYPAGYDVTLLC